MDSGDDQSNNDTTEVSKQVLVELAEVSLLLDSYDDIFSDFDPRTYAERILSDDFIIQAKKFFKSKSGKKMILKLLLPENKRREQDEKVIVKRLHLYFKNKYQQLATEIKKANVKGILLTAGGAAVMTIASYISFTKPGYYYAHLLLVLFEPAGWFLLWTGLDHLVYSSKDTRKELDFYSKLTKSEIKFLTY